MHSLGNLSGYEPVGYQPHITPTPLLLIVGRKDGLIGGNLAAAAYQTAAEPNNIVFVAGSDFAVHTGDGVELASRPRGTASRRNLG